MGQGEQTTIKNPRGIKASSFVTLDASARSKCNTHETVYCTTVTFQWDQIGAA